MKTVKIKSIADIRKVANDKMEADIPRVDMPKSMPVKKANMNMGNGPIKTVMPMKFDAKSLKRPLQISGTVHLIEMDDMEDEGDLDNQRAKRKK